MVWTAQKMGHKGGKISRRVLTTEQAREMGKKSGEKRKEREIALFQRLTGIKMVKEKT